MNSIFAQRRLGSRVFHASYGLGTVTGNSSNVCGVVQCTVAFDIVSEPMMVSAADLFDALPSKPKLTVIDGGLIA